MSGEASGPIPRWATALLIFVISLLLIIAGIFVDIILWLYYFITIALALMFWMYVDKQPPSNLGIRIEPRWWLSLILGLLFGAGIITILILIEITAGWVILTPIYSPDQWVLILGLLISYVLYQSLVAGAEELVGRGYIQQNLATGLSLTWAVFIGAVMFATLHVPGIMQKGIPIIHVIIMFVNLLLGGLVLGWAFVKTRNLWMSIGIHFGWNYVMYHIAGFGDGLFMVHSVMFEILTGGVIGPEAGILGTIGLISLFLIIWVFPSRWVTPSYSKTLYNQN